MGFRGQAYGKIQPKGVVTVGSSHGFNVECQPPQAVSNGAIQVNSAGSCELQNPGL
jgi:hypothetical protein